jgi:chemotaxis protein CheZ
MIKETDFIDQLMERVIAEVVDNLRDGITRTIEQEITKSLSRSLVESEFYRRLSEEMRSGLQEIYKEINAAAKSGADQAQVTDSRQADKLFHEAADQLDQILRTTEQATTEIMDIVEKHLDLQATSNQILHSLKSGGVSKEQLQQLRDQRDLLNQDLISIMTSLSFQDLTGQRIKRIIEAIKKVEQIVLDLYLSTGIKIKAREETPEKNLEEIEVEAQKKVSELKGPQAGADQANVDDLLAQLGLE